MSRPSSYRKGVAARICVEIATTPRGLEAIWTIIQDSQILEPYTDGYPKARSFVRCTRAKEDQIQILADEITPIADNVRTGEIVTLNADSAAVVHKPVDEIVLRFLGPALKDLSHSWHYAPFYRPWVQAGSPAVHEHNAGAGNW